MIIKLNPSGDEPIYVQLRNEIVLGIGNGQLALGQSLPTVRQLASETGINAMTVNKAYSILKNEGFIEIDRRHGAIVSPHADQYGEFKKKVESELQLLITESTLKGICKEQFLKICENLYENLSISTWEEESI
ncbi:MAG: GntR family transcriptional regulator [Clostridiales bacterium]|nr:GntR family transcriptional regulator [Clostridiales bacterium]